MRRGVSGLVQGLRVRASKIMVCVVFASVFEEQGTLPPLASPIGWLMLQPYLAPFASLGTSRSWLFDG